MTQDTEYQIQAIKASVYRDRVLCSLPETAAFPPLSSTRVFQPSLVVDVDPFFVAFSK